MEVNFSFSRFVIVQDFEIAKQIANDDKFCGRHETEYTRDLRGSGRNTGILTTNDSTWRTHRRFALSTLKGKQPE